VFFDALADRRLTLSSLLLLTSYVAAAPAEELVAGLAHKSLAQSREWLAIRFPQIAIETRMEFVTRDGERIDASAGTTVAPEQASASGQVALTRPAPAESQDSSESKGPLPGSRTWPLSAEYVAYQFSAKRRTHELMLRAMELLGRDVAANDLDGVIARGLELLVRELEKRKHGLHTDAKSEATGSTTTRHIPAAVRAEVFQRDGGQCAFMTDDGKRCECREALQYDHVVPLSQGGRTSVDNLRLLCAAHNQYEADRKLGRGFMEQKRKGEAPLVNHTREAFPGAEDVRAALITLQLRKDQIPTCMEFAAGLPREMSAAERVKAILRLRAQSRREALVGEGPGGGRPTTP
jgi:5-methylcytosine-specific restriction endonuclease McrA